MPFYFRKSVRFGPLRVNFSKSGVGVSAGVKGLRFGTGPRGHYVRAGLSGVYYHQGLGRQHHGRRQQAVSPRSSVSSSAQRAPWQSLDLREPSATRDAEMHEIDSTDVAAMRGEAYETLLADIQKRARRRRMAIILPLLILGGVVVAFWASSQAVVAWAAVLAVPAFIVAERNVREERGERPVEQRHRKAGQDRDEQPCGEAREQEHSDTRGDRSPRRTRIWLRLCGRQARRALHSARTMPDMTSVAAMKW